jgi:hypothetical protein
MIEAARAKSSGEAAAITYVAGDVRDMSRGARFDGAFSWYTSFGYEDDAGNLDVLRAIHAQLVEDGRFAIDVTNKDFLLRNFRETAVLERGDNFMIDRLSFDSRTSRMRNDRVYIRGGVKRASFSLRLFSFPELIALLGEAGFGAIEAVIDEAQLQAGIAPRIRLTARAV